MRWISIQEMPHPVALAGAVVVRGEVGGSSQEEEQEVEQESGRDGKRLQNSTGKTSSLQN